MFLAICPSVELSISMDAILDRLEEKWRNTFFAEKPPLGATNELQFFAWDEDPAGEGCVVCIGANYSQTPTKAQLVTKANLGSWMKNYCYAVDKLRCGWEKQWSENKWLGGSLPPFRPRYVIMSNLVPWITTDRWTHLSQVDTDNMIQLARSGACDYLDDLKLECPDAFAVGHGINKRTLPHLERAASKWENWMLYANLSFPQTPSAWDAKKGRFKFGGKCRKG